MKRQITLWPDQMVATPSGDMACVSGSALDAAMLEMSATLRTMGGHLLVAQDRVRVGPDEAVTVKAFLQWRSHPDANPNAETTIAVPEPQVAVAPALSEPPEFVDAGPQQEAAEAKLRADAEALLNGPEFGFEDEGEPDEDDVDSALPTAVH